MGNKKYIHTSLVVYSWLSPNVFQNKRIKHLKKGNYSPDSLAKKNGSVQFPIRRREDEYVVWQKDAKNTMDGAFKQRWSSKENRNEKGHLGLEKDSWNFLEKWGRVWKTWKSQDISKGKDTVGDNGLSTPQAYMNW